MGARVRRYRNGSPGGDILGLGPPSGSPKRERGESVPYPAWFRGTLTRSRPNTRHRSPRSTSGAAARSATRNYFFFSLCSVCFRSRGEYFLSFNFSPPLLRRSV